MIEQEIYIDIDRILNNRYHTPTCDDTILITAKMYSDKEYKNYMGLCAAEINKGMLNSLEYKVRSALPKDYTESRIQWNVPDYNWDGFCYVENEDCIYRGMKKVNKLIITAI